ncbi:hypothetical protein [Burkholderia multivorans]|uniref:hypothetical protein n=1 Tax=Burkholderia multivorans TaxID=87883 RepID=UPI001C26F8CA|nr:hypothetical protein [Burkholderia multivorans]MBU9526150.1 hypothetical protein [Burkholderia multivorans]
MTAEEFQKMLSPMVAQAINDSVATHFAPLRAEIEALKAAKALNDSESDKESGDEKKENDSFEASVKTADESASAPVDPLTAAPVTNDTPTNPETDEAQETAQNSEIAELKAKIAALEAAQAAQAAPAPALSDEEEAAIADAYTHADSIYQLHGMRAPKHMERESLIAYRRRLAKGLQKFSPAQKAVKLSEINDSALLSLAEREIYSDAANAANSREIRRPVRVVEKNVNGVRMQQLEGVTAKEWMSDFMAPGFSARLARPQ